MILALTLLLIQYGHADDSGLNPQPLGYHMSLTNGTSITVYEWDEYLNLETFAISQVLAGTASFMTDYNETISLWSDGEYLTINCTRPYVDGNGCNLGGAQLNGIPGYPRGIWAWELLNYTLGIGGNESTVHEILHVLGKSTLGDGNCSATIGFLGIPTPLDLLMASLDGPYIAQLNETITFTATAPPPVWLFRWDIPADGLFDTAWIFDPSGRNTIELILLELVDSFACVNVWDGSRPRNESHTECAPLNVMLQRPPRPPEVMSASLIGGNLESVLINWTLS